ncbi:hypothetical protein GIV47_13565 [Pseudomonas marginalis]|nr:hypothetical protein [Pseudomonas marginalis]
MPASTVTSLTKKTMSLPKHHLELLSPARDVAIAREAILHGADAIYIGGPRSVSYTKLRAHGRPHSISYVVFCL